MKWRREVPAVFFGAREPYPNPVKIQIFTIDTKKFLCEAENHDRNCASAPIDSGRFCVPFHLTTSVILARVARIHNEHLQFSSGEREIR